MFAAKTLRNAGKGKLADLILKRINEVIKVSLSNKLNLIFSLSYHKELIDI